jgi:Signal recognition particle, alpha subunit, N-terminal
MLDYFAIFTKGGALLWAFQLTALKGDPVDALVRSCLLEERSAQSSFTYAPPGAASYTLKWSFHNASADLLLCWWRGGQDAQGLGFWPPCWRRPQTTSTAVKSPCLPGNIDEFGVCTVERVRHRLDTRLRPRSRACMQGLGLVFVAVYQKALKLLYVDELLEGVKAAFTVRHYDPRKCVDDPSVWLSGWHTDLSARRSWMPCPSVHPSVRPRVCITRPCVRPSVCPPLRLVSRMASLSLAPCTICCMAHWLAGGLAGRRAATLRPALLLHNRRILLCPASLHPGSSTRSLMWSSSACCATRRPQPRSLGAPSRQSRPQTE